MSDKPVTDQAKDTADSAKKEVTGKSQAQTAAYVLIDPIGTPAVFDKQGAVGKQFQPDGAVSGADSTF